MTDGLAPGEDTNPETGMVDDAPLSAQASEAHDAAESEDLTSELQRELTLERDKLLRLAAEFDNFRKRVMKERAEAEARGQASLVAHLLDPLDDISRFAHVDPAVTDSATLVEGVAMVEKKFEKSLRAAGLETVNPVNQRFDPALHEAVATEPAPSPELDGTVSRVYQAGYTFKGQLLRPARVVVRQYLGPH
ncbi:MAG: nucleotide exchange factor GrpE [Gemmatimonadales bacterium]